MDTALSLPEALDTRALEALYERLERRVYNVVYRWVWDREEARDIVQDAFVKLWEMRARVDVTTVDALVFRIAVNLASNRRRYKKLRELVGLDHLVTAPHDAVRTDDDRRVRTAILALPDKLRAVVVMAELSGLSHAEIAAVLGIPEGTVASRRHHGNERLRIALGALFEEPS